MDLIESVNLRNSLIVNILKFWTILQEDRHP